MWFVAAPTYYFGNLRKEGTPDERIKFVGNIMIDTLELIVWKFRHSELKDIIKEIYSLGNLNIAISKDHNYALMTYTGHPCGQQEVLEQSLIFFKRSCFDHYAFGDTSRTLKQLNEFNLFDAIAVIRILFYWNLWDTWHVAMNVSANVMLTIVASAGRVYYSGNPCLTLRRTPNGRLLLKIMRRKCSGRHDVKLIRKEFKKACSNPGFCDALISGWKDCGTMFESLLEYM